MSVIQVQVSVSKEASELGDGLVKFVSDVKQALADGWQPGSDLPALLQATIADLVPAVQGVEKLGAEIVENEEAFVTAFMLSGKKIVYVFKK